MGEDQSQKSIRWSDDGESFMIVNEEAFSTNCLPTVFKHNNYASFVRQLNMYGFHKVVGLGDNSKSSSESGAKAPSVYQHPYFKRDRPHLLWLITKPKTPSSQPKRKKEDGKARSGDGVSDDDSTRDVTAGGNIPQHAFQSKKMDDSAKDDVVEIPRAELVTMRSELSNLLQQQNIISASIMHLRRQNEQLYNQVASAQSLHDRHENSINAILTFLATIYNQSLENPAGQNRGRVFPSSMPTPPQQGGSVVDVGDVGEATVNSNESPRAVRRPIALLPAPLATTMEALGSPIGDAPASREADAHAATVPSLTDVGTIHGSQSDASTDSQPQRNAAVIHATGKSDPESTRSDNYADAASDTSPATDIISVINNVNAQNNTTPTESDFDFSAALNQFQSANGNSPLSSQERSDVLHRLATNGSDAGNVAGGPIMNDINNAFLSSMTSSMPSLDTFAASQNQLDLLQRLQQEQASKVQRLVDRVQSHSPTGVIPGLGDADGGSGNTTAAATPVTDSADESLASLDYEELTNLLSSADFPVDEDAVPQTTQAEHFDLGFDLEDQDVLNLDFGVHSTPGTEVYGGTVGFDAGPHAFEGRDFAGGHAAVAGRIVESLSSEATSPAATVADDFGGGNEHESVASAPPSKKRRVA